MLISRPDYYKEFQCTADQCEDTCCAGWQIVVDPKSLEKYKHVKHSFKSRIRKGVDFQEGTFRQKDEKRCAFLNDQNLCDMYIALGSKSLCKTCRLYPRHIEEFEGVREVTLSLSCPEVAKILMNRLEPVAFQTVEVKGEEEFDDFDLFLYSELLDARDVIREILQNRSLPVEVRGGLFYGIARDMQRRINNQELFSCHDVFEKYQKPQAEQFVRNKLFEIKEQQEKLFVFAKKRFRLLYELEVLKEEWDLLLIETDKKLFLDHTAQEYMQLTEEFNKWIAENQFPWEIQKEQLLVYFVDTYLCGAVYDGDVLAKAQMALFSVGILEDLLKIRWLRNEKQMDVEDVIELVYRYSREVEHSDENLKKMERMMPITNGVYC